MKHLNNFEKHNENILSIFTEDKIAKEVLNCLKDINPDSIEKEENLVCTSYTWEMLNNQILFGKNKVEIVNYKGPIILLIDGKKIRCSRSIANQIWKKVEDLLGE